LCLKTPSRLKYGKRSLYATTKKNITPPKQGKDIFPKYGKNILTKRSSWGTITGISWK
jgi:hypothetical protein